MASKEGNVILFIFGSLICDEVLQKQEKLQSVLMIILSTLAIMVHDCNFSMKGDPFSYAMYLVYFLNKDCGLVDWQNLGVEIPPEIQPIFYGGTSAAAQRTLELARYYLVLNSIMLIGSIVLIVGACRNSKSKVENFFIFWLFILSVVANITLDGFGVAMYWEDVKNTGSLLKFLEFLEFVNFEALYEYLPDYETHLTRLPSLLMLIFAARLFIIPLANAWFVLITIFIYFEVNSEIDKQGKVLSVAENGEFLPEPVMVEAPEEPQKPEAPPVTVTPGNRPTSVLQNPEFEQELEGVLARGLKHYEDTGLSNVYQKNEDENAIESIPEPHMLTGPNYPEFMKTETVEEASESAKKTD